VTSRTPHRTSDPVSSKPRRPSRVPRDAPRTPRRTSARWGSHAGIGDRAYRASPDSGAAGHDTASPHPGSRQSSASRPSPGGWRHPEPTPSRLRAPDGLLVQKSFLYAVRGVEPLQGSDQTGDPRAHRSDEGRRPESSTCQCRIPRMPKYARRGEAGGEAKAPALKGPWQLEKPVGRTAC
jgi:hypothetical protein